MTRPEADKLAQHLANEQDKIIYVIRCKAVGFTVELKEVYDRNKSTRAVLAVKRPGD
jgi:hypothetical protein